MQKSICKYDGQCYRNNPVHFDQFDHPIQFPNGNNEKTDPTGKKQKLEMSNIDLPNDILGVIVSFLSSKEINSFHLCSKNFHEIATNCIDYGYLGLILEYLKIRASGLKRNPMTRHLTRDYLPDKFAKDYVSLQSLNEFSKTFLSNRQAQGVWEDLKILKALRPYQFELPIDTMGGNEADMTLCLAVPTRIGIIHKELINLEIAEANIDESMFEENPRVESHEGDDAFDSWMKEMNHELESEDGRKRMEYYDPQSIQAIKNGVKSFPQVKKIFQDAGIGFVKYQKAHYYWEDGEYNQGWMIFYGWTKNGNLIAFHWQVYHNV